ncbi:MAG: DNA polymerase I [Methylomonas sp.]|nr:DNA polymerase I [Methylomonas sp.]PPD22143.1 MAG: DNA polymerase I [Methylomonas sp.]PPD26162.1 MAG: DNA polymerase I [Methylomonas sp.]PPD37877.1 MAG: DNA polymerase I [Methylomonas sp.]PPD42473.1 MAG: DNA polymerase I [Methylomonas sp.]
MSDSNLLVLIDGSSFLFRAYHAVPPLTNAQGQPTHAVYGVSNMLRKLLNDYATAYFAVIFDAPGKTFRHDLYEQYKAHRPPMPDDLRVQIEPLHDLIRALGLPLIVEAGVEADDVMGSLAQNAARQGFKVIISTSDKDMAQLVSEQITLENSMTGSRMDIAGVEEKFGVRPEQIIDYLALMGDAVDNIPGVAKVGPKTAAKWLQTYGTLDNLIAHADDIKGKVGDNLRDALDQLPLSRQLTTIQCDVALHYSLDDLKRKAPDIAALKTHLSALGFNSWLKTLNGEATTSTTTPATAPEPARPAAPTTRDYQTVLSQADFDHWLDKLQRAELFAFDSETTSLDASQAEIVGVSFAVEAGQAAYVPLAHTGPDAPAQLARDRVLAALKPLLEDAGKAKLGQNLKYDAHVLHNHDIDLQGIRHDTMLQSYVLNSTATKHNMDDLAKHYLGVETIHYEDVCGKGAKQIGFADVSIEQASEYAAEDADISLRLHQTLSAQLQQHPRLWQLYTDIEMPLVEVLTRIERNGVLIDSDMLAEQSQVLTDRMIALEMQAHDVAGSTFNLGSPKQIQEILYDRLHLPVLKKTPKGQPSTDESVLQELAVDYPLPRLILQHRGLSKLKSTYTDKLPQQINRKTGRVHTSYHQAVAATGRLSSSDPNLQNIPIRSEEGRKIRQAFIAPPGYSLVAADYSQIELRIMAHLSGDDGLLAAFSQGEDIHRATAAEVFGIAVDQVTNDLRRSAKAINFGLIYGMSAFGLAQQLGLPRNQAQAYIDLYFSRYPGVKRYMDDIRAQAKTLGYVETLFGRRLYLPDINARNQAQRQYAERTAINAPMQGSAADIIKRAMIACDGWIRESGTDIKLIMQVHDELVFEVADSVVDDCIGHIRHLMTHAATLNVPLLVDVGRGTNWDEAH